MANPYNVQDFITHKAQNKEFKPKHHFLARVVLAEKAPTFSYTLPRGELALYPDYLAFFTLNMDSPGTKLLFKEFLKTYRDAMASSIKLNEWVQDPTELLLDLAVGLFKDFKNEDALSKALMNPNSIFVPHDQIIGSKFNKGIVGLRPHHIVVSLRDDNLIIYQDPVTENQFKALLGQFTGKWQEEFQKALNAIAESNS